MNLFQTLLGGTLFIFSLVLFFSPLIISILTGNWWFMFLFAVSWIAGLGTLMLMSVAMED